MFERPKKNDLDTALSMLMHENRHKLREEVNRIKGEAIKAGALNCNRVVVTAVAAADTMHKAAIEEAHNILLDFIERMGRAPTEIVDWARPHLENLNNSVLGVVPPNGFPQDHQRLTHQYRAVFQQRLDIMLRNVEIGHQKGAGFARAEKVESKEEWISAAAALNLLKPTMNYSMATKAICARAHDGVVRACAEHYVWGNQSAVRYNIPKEFWWARGYEALDQNWMTGDFETWIDNRIHLKAYGVSFLRADIERMLPHEQLRGAEEVKMKTKHSGKNIFIGHGRSQVWLSLERFLKSRLHLDVEEFNSSPSAGVQTASRLEEMLDNTVFAFLVMTAEDESSDGKFNPRLNVVHEAGLFQGRLGFKKAIILLEEGCEGFSNIDGLGQIRFPKGDISPQFEEIRRTLEREGVIAVS